MKATQRKQGMDRRTLGRILRGLKRYRLLLTLSLLFAAGNVALTLYIPLLTGSAIDLILGPGHGKMAEVMRPISAEASRG